MTPRKIPKDPVQTNTTADILVEWSDNCQLYYINNKFISDFNVLGGVTGGKW